MTTIHVHLKGILPEGLKRQAQVLLVVEMPEEPETVELVVRVSVVQLLEELQLFKSSFLPEKWTHL